MIFKEEQIRKIEEDPVIGISEACDVINAHLDDEMEGESGWTEYAHEILWEGCTFLILAIENSQIGLNVSLPNATADIGENCTKLLGLLKYVSKVFHKQSLELKISAYKSRYQSAFKNSFAFEFSKGDYDRIQTLVNELREQISQNEKLEEDHKRRLLKRLENLQSELHKRVSDLDRFWGMVGDAGVVIGKLGKDAKPIVDRVKEIAEIVWKTQARTEELPSDSGNPLLEDNDVT